MLTSLLCNGLERVPTAKGVRTYCYIKLVCLRDHSSASTGSMQLHLHSRRVAVVSMACQVQRRVHYTDEQLQARVSHL